MLIFKKKDFYLLGILYIILIFAIQIKDFRLPIQIKTPFNLRVCSFTEYKFTPLFKIHIKYCPSIS